MSEPTVEYVCVLCHIPQCGIANIGGYEVPLCIEHGNAWMEYVFETDELDDLEEAQAVCQALIYKGSANTYSKQAVLNLQGQKRAMYYLAKQWVEDNAGQFIPPYIAPHLRP